MTYGPVFIGLASAALFGLATPLSKLLLHALSQFQLAGLLYLGAGLGMVPFVLAGRKRRGPRGAVNRTNALRLLCSVVLGGGVAPVLLLLGLAAARASSVSLWLNLELAATAVLGSLVFKDHLNGIGWVGVLGALAAGVLVTVGEGVAGILPGLAVGGACLCWGLDNNLTALIDGLTPQEVTFCKGIGAGAVNFLVGSLSARAIPAVGPGLESLALGAVSYGGSIALYIASAQRLGAARGQVLFATAPFIGALVSILVLAERPSWVTCAAAGILAASILTMRHSRHVHRHFHEPITHIHEHRHDDLHHAHVHPGMPADLTHTHEHTHEALEHEHAHYPDLHHRHSHGKPAH